MRRGCKDSRRIQKKMRFDNFVRKQSGTVADSSNFRTDVTVNGLINSSDISTVKSKSGTAIP